METTANKDNKLYILMRNLAADDTPRDQEEFCVTNRVNNNPRDIRRIIPVVSNGTSVSLSKRPLMLSSVSV